MPLDPLKFKLPISVQIGVVAALFIAALVILWTTGAAVVVARAPQVGGQGDARTSRRSARSNGA